MNNTKIIFFLFLLKSFTSLGQSSIEIAKNAINSTISVIALDKTSQPLAYGSGFIIDEKLIATNVHVIKGASSAYILVNGVQKNLTIDGYVAIDKPNDLVILKISDLRGTKLILSSAKLPDIGEKIYAVGNPKGLNGTFSEGIVSGIREMDGNQVLQITAPISPGSSGGPVLDSKGEVVGIAFASFTGGQNLNFAIPVKYLQTLKTKISIVQSLSLIKSDPKSNIKSPQITPNTKEGVEVRNLSSSYNTGGPYRPITFSIKNNLPYPVSDIEILIIVYDKTGTVVNYYEKTYLTYSQGIKPYLALTFNENYSIPTGTGYKLEARILNYKILENK